MGFSFFAPLLLVGAALLSIPWLVHQIRRPERELFPFSSLMFVPNVYRKTIERQSIQHILLMLLRMLCLLLLALAFSRPYFSWTLSALDEGENARHLILLDASASMQAGDRSEKAKAAAIEILGELGKNDRVALGVFDRKLTLLVPFDPDVFDSVQRERIEREIERYGAGYRSTDYTTVLQKAQELILSNDGTNGDSKDRKKKRIVHLIGDLQKTGVSKQDARWKLSPQIDLHLLDAGEEDISNLSISDISVRNTKSGETIVTGQIKNPSENNYLSHQVKLFVNEREIESRELSIAPRQSTKVTFKIPPSIDGNISGYLQMNGDDFSIDDRRYFATNQPRKKRVWTVNRERSPDSWPASWFVSRALQTAAKQNWEIVSKDRLDSFEGLLQSDRPDIVVVCGLNEIDRSDSDDLLAFAESGGGALIAFDPDANNDSLNSLLNPLGFSTSTESISNELDSGNETFSWIDFEHPVFSPLKGSKFNDFTSIQFNHFLILKPSANSDGNNETETNRVFARFPNSHPAAIDIPYGEGRFVAWTFTPNLQSTNLPKSPRFIPILLETLNLLSGRDETQKAFTVGESLFDLTNDLDADGNWIASLPGESSGMPLEGNSSFSAIQANRPGVIQVGAQNAPNESRYYAVNVETSETDLTKMPVNQFKNTFVSTFNDTIVAAETDDVSNKNETVQKEWGRYLLLILLLGLAVETVYAARIAQKQPQTENE